MIAVLHIKFISSILKIYALLYLNTYKEIYHLQRVRSLGLHSCCHSSTEVKAIHYSNFQSTSFVRRKKERYLDLRG